VSHEHIFRRWVKTFQVPGWLGLPGEHDYVVYLCRCGTVGYPIFEEVPA
jgi:hypothetical protein